MTTDYQMNALVRKLTSEIERLTAERDVLRGLLREAYPHVWPVERDLSDSLRARIDAALKKDNGA